MSGFGIQALAVLAGIGCLRLKLLDSTCLNKGYLARMSARSHFCAVVSTNPETSKAKSQKPEVQTSTVDSCKMLKEEYDGHN